MKNSEKTLDMIVTLCKNRGYVYAGSEIYGGLANSWAWRFPRVFRGYAERTRRKRENDSASVIQR